jgi:hypothetical protein
MSNPAVKRNPSKIIAKHLASHAASLQKIQRRIELLMPQLQAAIAQTRKLAEAFERESEKTE